MSRYANQKSLLDEIRGSRWMGTNIPKTQFELYVRRINPAAVKMFGYSAAEVIGHNLSLPNVLTRLQLLAKAQLAIEEL